MNKYLAYYRGKEIEVEAPNSYAAQQLAMTHDGAEL
jgi:hypothetical protein